MYKMVHKNGEPVINDRTGEPVVGDYDACMGIFYRQRLTGVRIRFNHG